MLRTFVLPARILASDCIENSTITEHTSARLDRGNRPFRLCLRINLQLARREADAKATAEGLANTVLLKNIPHRSFKAFRDAADPTTHRPEQLRRAPVVVLVDVDLDPDGADEVGLGVASPIGPFSSGNCGIRAVLCLGSENGLLL
ncbi:MAG: hypothetical protein CMJ48_09525 [Planctomycetaceae bacterium]|nr:hypothetical protein [Planctomycetaceae bacterium]